MSTLTLTRGKSATKSTTPPTIPPDAPRAAHPHRNRRPAHPRRTRLIVLAVVILGWWALAEVLNNSLLLPGPGEVAGKLVAASTCQDVICGVQDYFLWQHVLATVERIAVGLTAGVIVGVLLGWWLGSNARVRGIIDPYLSFLRALPPLGYIGLLIVWFGIGDGSKVALIFLATFPTVAISTILGVTGIKADWLLAARTLGATRRQELTRVAIPGAAPEIVGGIRLATGTAWACIVAAEMNDGIPGIGGLAYISGTQLDTGMALGAVLVIGTVALVIDRVLARIQERLSPGRGR